MATIAHYERLPAPTTSRVSVVICADSGRRWSALVDAVASAREQNPEPNEVVVVVDHDDELLARAARALRDALVVANEEGRGLSGARSTGLRHASGEIVVFVDDDASARPGWLQVLTRAVGDRPVIGLGGVALPASAPLAPAWIPSALLWVAARRGLRHGPVRQLA